MNLSELLMFVSVAGLLAILIGRVYNLMCIGKAYNNKISIVAFICGVALFTLSIIVSMINYEVLIFSVINTYVRYLFGLNVILFLSEYFYLYTGLFKASKPHYRRQRV